MKSRSTPSARVPIYSVVFFLLSQIGLNNARADKAIPPEVAIQVLQAIENSLKSSQYSVTYAVGKLGTKNDISTFKPNPKLTGTGTSCFDPATNRYRYDSRSMLEWFKGKADYSGHDQGFSFDGKTERKFDRASGTDRLPKAGDPPPEGEIDYEKKAEFLRLWGWNSGIGFFPPLFMNSKLSDFIQHHLGKKSTISIIETDTGIWRLTMPDEGGYFDVQLQCDLNKNAICSEAIWYKGNTTKVHKKLTGTFQQSPEGMWYPQSYNVYYPIEEKLSQLTYRDVKIGEHLDEGRFRIEFPPDTRVTDRTQSKFYVVGRGAKSDQEQVRDFMLREGLRPPTENPWSFTSIALLVSALLLGVLNFILYRRRHRAKTSAILFLAVFPVLNHRA